MTVPRTLAAVASAAVLAATAVLALTGVLPPAPEHRRDGPMPTPAAPAPPPAGLITPVYPAPRPVAP